MSKPQSKGKDRDDAMMDKALKPAVDALSKSIDKDILSRVIKAENSKPIKPSDTYGLC